MEGSDPELYGALKEIARAYKEGKRVQAEHGDLQGIPCPHPESTGVRVQYLHKIFPNTNRFFSSGGVEVEGTVWVRASLGSPSTGRQLGRCGSGWYCLRAG